MPPHGIDRISDLPESLITQILLHLPTKDTVKTSVLSSQWKNLWLNVPGLDLNSSDFLFSRISLHVFPSFIDRFLDRNPNSRLEKFKLSYNTFQIRRYKDVIESAINRGIRTLELDSNIYYRDHDYDLVDPNMALMPLNLYKSKTLVSLKLSYSSLDVGMDDIPSGFVSMPCLKSMHLSKIDWRIPCIMNLEKLVLGCPVLEELTYVKALHYNTYVYITRVRSQSLKRLYVPCVNWYQSMISDNETLEIDAPGLEYLSLQEDHFDSIVLVKNLTCLSTIDLNIKFVVDICKSFDPEDLEKRNGIRDFLDGILCVRHMIISHRTLETLERYSEVGSVPKFKSLSRLEAEFTSDLLKYLPVFLESFPNLKHLILVRHKIVYFTEDEIEDELVGVHDEEIKEELVLVGVPGCFDTTLECVEVKGFYLWEEDHEMKIASYFLENSAMLKKLVLSFRERNMRNLSNSEICEELSKLTKRSRSCQVTVCDE